MFLLEELHYHKTKPDLKSVTLPLDLLVRDQCLLIIGAFKELNTFSLIIRIWESFITVIIILRIRNEVQWDINKAGLPTEFMKSSLRLLKNTWDRLLRRRGDEMNSRNSWPMNSDYPLASPLIVQSWITQNQNLAFSLWIGIMCISPYLLLM